MKSRARYAVAGTALLALVVIAVGLSVILIGRAVQTSNRRWCDTLTLITARPVPKPADPKTYPSRENQYELNEDFLKLRREFGC